MARPSRERGKLIWPGGWWRSLGSILVGNAVYYAVVDYLPPGARHRPYAFDWGLLVDLWFCVAFYGLSCMIWPRRKR